MHKMYVQGYRPYILYKFMSVWMRVGRWVVTFLPKRWSERMMRFMQPSSKLAKEVVIFSLAVWTFLVPITIARHFKRQLLSSSYLAPLSSFYRNFGCQPSLGKGTKVQNWKGEGRGIKMATSDTAISKWFECVLLKSSTASGDGCYFGSNIGIP